MRTRDREICASGVGRANQRAPTTRSVPDAEHHHARHSRRIRVRQTHQVRYRGQVQDAGVGRQSHQSADGRLSARRVVGRRNPG